MYTSQDEYHNAYDPKPTATEEEQLRIKEAFQNGAAIEAKGRDSIFVETAWAEVEKPRFDFHRNHYRVKKPTEILETESPSP